MSYESEDLSYKNSYDKEQHAVEYRIKQDSFGGYGIYDYRNGERYSYSGGGWTLEQAVALLNKRINGE